MNTHALTNPNQTLCYSANWFDNVQEGIRQKRIIKRISARWQNIWVWQVLNAWHAYSAEQTRVRNLLDRLFTRLHNSRYGHRGIGA